MKVQYLKRFSKDLDNLTKPKDKNVVLQVILSIKDAKTLADISNIKKLTGFSNAYRVRVGDYRIGIFVEGDTVQFARIAHRKDIYKIFP
jgi:mRNA interferase RelE/StbE